MLRFHQLKKTLLAKDFQAAVLLAPIAFLITQKQDFSNYSILMIVIVYPIIEEIVFRGMIQPKIASYQNFKLASLSAANLITSVCFAIMHLLVLMDLQALWVFFPSIIFGWLKDRKGLLAPILCHIIYNFFFVIASLKLF